MLIKFVDDRVNVLSSVYVLCTHDERGYHPVGFFSKEKYSDLGFNLACILTFPSAQRKGYGRFLIAFSYELSKKEEKAGSPEKPLSDLGALSYKSYWASTILAVLRNFQGHQISILDITKMTSIVVEDVSATLQMLGLLQCVNGIHSIYAPPDLIDELMEKYPASGLHVDPEKLQWVPLYVTDARKDKWSLKAKKDGQFDGSVSFN
jgi:histone acetyltransferase MYST1